MAEAFFADQLATTGYAKASVSAGEVPVIKGGSSMFSGQQLASDHQTITTSVQKAPSFQYSWDQALSPAEATTMLTNLAQVFELSRPPRSSPRS